MTKARKKPSKRNAKPVAVTTKHQTKKGGRVCLVCAHPERPELDRGLVSGSLKPADVARRVGCSRPSVGRHQKNHLIPDVKTAVKAVPGNESDNEIDVGVETRSLYARVKGILVQMETEKNWKVMKGFCSEARGCLELLGKYLGKIETGNTVNVILSPAWVQVRAVILQALASFPEARIATAQALIEYEKTAAPGGADAPSA